MVAAFDLIIFDCDGVLVDSEVIASRVLAEALTQAGFAISASECRTRFTGRSLSSVVTEIEGDLGTKLPKDFLVDLRRRDVEAFERDLEPIPGVSALIENQPCPVCVASSGGMVKIRHSLTLTGLISLFDPHIFSAEQVTQGKPAPDLFLFAAQRMGVAPEKCLVIEDSLAGVKAARAANMTTIGFLGGSHIITGFGDQLLDAGAISTCQTMAELAQRLVADLS